MGKLKEYRSQVSEALMATTENRLRANRQNALQSTGPKTEAGRDMVRSNAIRHGLRCVQTVVPGESADEWDNHRNAIVADLNPQGVMESALTDQVAAGLWRLGRVIRFESDMIAIGQDPAELAHVHEKTCYRGNGAALTKTNIPTRMDVEKARDNAKEALEKLSELQSALRQLESLAGMDDGAEIEDWSIFDPLRIDLRLEERQTDKIFNGDEPFVARHVRAMLKIRGSIDEVTASMAKLWREKKLPKLDAESAAARKKAQGVQRRYTSALDRLARGRGLPDDASLQKVTRYESHLWRIVHRALDRLRDFQEVRGAVPARGPSIAVAVVQAGSDTALGLFGEN